MWAFMSAALMAAGLGAVAAPASEPPQTPCVSAAEACVAWIPLGFGVRAMAYSTYPLTRPNAAVRRALIMIHGTKRNADHYFATATGAAFLAGALGDTLVIAPAFHSPEKGCDDQLRPNEVSWGCLGDSWRSGGAASRPSELTSFQFIDAILTRLADKALFPNLKRIVVAGHSAGGQFVARYQMANRVHDRLGVGVAYVIANPSSYAWPDPSRPLPIQDADPANAALGWRLEVPHADFVYGPFDAARAPGYDQWPYGLKGRTSGYTVGVADAQLKAQLASRPATYLFSQVDVLPLGGFDGSPSAMAQGPTRRARGEAFVHFLNSRLGGRAAMAIVPECGHNDRCVFTTEAVLPVIFPDPGP